MLELAKQMFEAKQRETSQLCLSGSQTIDLMLSFVSVLEEKKIELEKRDLGFAKLSSELKADVVKKAWLWWDLIDYDERLKTSQKFNFKRIPDVKNLSCDRTPSIEEIYLAYLTECDV